MVGRRRRDAFSGVTYELDASGNRVNVQPIPREAPGGNILQPIQDAIDSRRTGGLQDTPPVSNLPPSQDISPQDNSQRNNDNSNRGTNRNLFPDGSSTMDNVEPQTAAASVQRTAAATSSATASSGGARKRAIMPMYTTPNNFYLEERAMVVLPLKFNFSINKVERSRPLVFKFKLNELYNQFSDVSFTAQNFGNVSISQKRFDVAFTDADGAGGSTTGAGTHTFIPGDVGSIQDRSRGFSQDMAFDQLDTNTGTQVPKPVNANCFECRQFKRTVPTTTVPSGAAAGDWSGTTGSGVLGSSTGDLRPDFRNFYEPMYQVRHVHGCRWKLTLESAAKTDAQEMVVFHKTETVTTGLASAGENLGLTSSSAVPLHEISGYKHLNSETIKGKYSVVSGNWRSDSAHHDVVDGDEIREWYPTATDPTSPNTLSPQYTEYETMLFYSNTAHEGCWNAFMEIDWLVEYKDLRRAFRYIKRETENTTLLGHTGKLSDMYPHWPTPAEGASAAGPPVVPGWPRRKNLTNGDVAQLNDYFNHMANNMH